MFLLLTTLSAASAYDLDQTKRSIDWQGDRLLRVASETVVDATPDDAWAALLDFGAAEHIVASITDADVIGDTEMGVGCERYCNIDFQGRQVYVEERIFELVDGSHYTYAVTKSEGFPINAFNVTFGVRVDDAGATRVYNIVDYKLKPSLLSPFQRGTLRESALTSVLGYRYAIETQSTTPLTADALRARYLS